ncbi:MAG: hypothetical protein ACM3XS_03920 [Bacteroidota bacterium]
MRSLQEAKIRTAFAALTAEQQAGLIVTGRESWWRAFWRAGESPAPRQ